MRLPVIIINDCWEYIIELELENWRTRCTKYSPTCPVVFTSGMTYRTVLTTGRDENTSCPVGTEYTISVQNILPLAHWYHSYYILFNQLSHLDTRHNMLYKYCRNCSGIIMLATFVTLWLQVVQPLANVHETKWTPHVKRETDVAQSYTSSAGIYQWEDVPDGSDDWAG